MKHEVNHAADIHLGSPMLGLTNYERTPIAEVRNARN